MSSLSSILLPIQRNTVFGLSWIYLTFGFTGCLLNIFLFSRRQFRTMSCCAYFLAASVAMSIQLTLFVVSTIYSYYYLNPATYIVPYCKFRMYLNQITSFSFRWAYTAAIVDRYAMSSPKARLRRLASVHIAYRVIGLLVIISALSTIYTPFVFDIKRNACGIFTNDFWQVYASIYTLIVGSFFPMLIMLIFTFLIRKNLREKRQRRLGFDNQQQTRSKGEHIQQKRDQQALRMLFAQVIVFIIITIPWMTYSLNMIISPYIPNRSTDYMAVESFISSVASALIYIYPTISFYLYTLTSSLFRKELGIMLRSLFWWKRRNNSNRIEPAKDGHPLRVRVIPPLDKNIHMDVSCSK